MALYTNVVALCQLNEVEWHVFVEHSTASSSTKTTPIPVDPNVASPLLLLQMEESQEQHRQKKLQEADALRRKVTIHDHFRQMKALNMLCVLQKHESCEIQEPDEHDEQGLQLWVFIVNGRHDVPTLKELEETSHGKWVRGKNADDAPLVPAIQSILFEALEKLFVQKCLKGEFELQQEEPIEKKNPKNALLVLKEPQFVYRRPSLSRLNQYELYLREQLEMPAFQCRFQLLRPSHLLTVAIQMTHFVDGKVVYDDNAWTSRMRRGWEAMMGLPRPQDHAMVDVWHADAPLVARIMCETRYGDVVALFQPTDKRKRRRRTEADEDKGGTIATGTSASASGADEKRDDEDPREDEGEDEEDEEEEEEEDPNASNSSIGGPSARKKTGRKKQSATKFELEESTVPTSPDINLSNGSSVRVCFGSDTSTTSACSTTPAAADEADWQLHTSRHVHIFKRKRRKAPVKCNFSNALSGFQAPVGSGGLTVESPSLILDAVLTTRAMSKGASGKFNGASAGVGVDLGISSASGIAERLNTPPSTSASLLQTSSLTGSVSLMTDVEQKPKPTPGPELPTISPSGAPSTGQPLKRKMHPLLEALQQEVRQGAHTHKETKKLLLTVHHDEQVANAHMYEATRPIASMSKCQTMLENATKWFVSQPRFKKWQVDYSRARKTAKQSSPRTNQILLNYDPTKLDEFKPSESMIDDAVTTFKIRDVELEFGTRWLAKDALTSWQQPYNSWQAANSQLQGKPTDERDRSRFAARVLPYVKILRTFLGPQSSPTKPTWMNLDEFCQASCNSADGESMDVDMDVDLENRLWMHTMQMPRPELAVATANKIKCVGTSAVSEWMLRGWHPVTCPKSLEYVVVCPHSPGEWVATLAESYLCDLKSLYQQSNLGAQQRVDLRKIPSNPHVSVDAVNAFLLVHCATSIVDAFQTYRRAGEMLQASIIGQENTSQQSGTAKVVYLVAPFRHQDVKHRVWMMGAFARGLFGVSETAKSPMVSELPLQLDGVVLEVLFLDELCEMSVDSSPFRLLPNCLALYNRVSHCMTLTPVDTSLSGGEGSHASSPASCVRYLSERAFHLAPESTQPDMSERKASRVSMEPGEEVQETVPIRAHGAYAISSDDKWLFVAFSDQSGSVVETHALNLATDFPDEKYAMRLRRGLAFVWDKFLSFLTLFGERGAAVWCKKGELTELETIVWRDLNAQTLKPQSSENGEMKQLDRYAKLLQLSVLVQMTPCTSIQLRYNEDGLQKKPVRAGNQHLTESYGVFPKRDVDEIESKVATRCGFLAVSPYESGGESRVLALARANVQHTTVPKRDEVLFQVTWKESSSARPGVSVDQAEILHRIVREYADLSWLTLHPFTLERQSPWPLHLAALDKMQWEYDELQKDLGQVFVP